jgi:hypothetical protein
MELDMNVGGLQQSSNSSKIGHRNAAVITLNLKSPNAGFDTRGSIISPNVIRPDDVTKVASPVRVVCERSQLLNTPSSQGSTSPSGPPPRIANVKKCELRSVPIPESQLSKANESPAVDPKFMATIFVSYVILALFNKLLQKLQTYPMYNYPIFLNQLTIFAYIPLCFAYVWPMRRWGSAITNDQVRNKPKLGIVFPCSHIRVLPSIAHTSCVARYIFTSQVAIPKYKFLVMGALDCLSAVMSMFAVVYITNSSTIVRSCVSCG